MEPALTGLLTANHLAKVSRRWLFPGVARYQRTPERRDMIRREEVGWQARDWGPRCHDARLSGKG
jgi:hypothetical protein